MLTLTLKGKWRWLHSGEDATSAIEHLWAPGRWESSLWDYVEIGADDDGGIGVDHPGILMAEMLNLLNLPFHFSYFIQLYEKLLLTFLKVVQDHQNKTLFSARIKTQTIPMTVSTQLWWGGVSCLLMLSVTYLPMLLLCANVLLQIVFSHKQLER